MIHHFSSSAPKPMRWFLAAALAITLIATALAIRPMIASAQGLHGIGFVKGCESPTPIGDPYACSYAVFNNVDTGNGITADTLTISSIVDVVHADPSDVTSTNLLPSLSLTLSGGATCNGGQTSCTLPPGSSIMAAPFSFYNVDNTDPSPLTDTATLTWQDTCSSGAPNCPIGNQISTSGSQTTIQKINSTTVTQVHNDNHTDITNTTVLAGTSVHDQATVSGAAGTPTGTVDFDLFANNTCEGEASSTELGVALSGGVAESSTTTATGGLSYIAHYNGDATYNPSDGICEPLNTIATPHLIVIKHVINDDGGTAVAGDFPITVTATNPSPANFAGAEAPGTDVTLDAGSYSVAETTSPDYTASYSADCTGTIANGETKTCTVTNDDVAPPETHLIVIKHVINDNGGTKTASDFTMTISGITATGGNAFAGAEAPGTNKIVTTGSYGVTEGTVDGYTVTYSADCNGSIAEGETKTCTVTNDDIAIAVFQGCSPGYWKQSQHYGSYPSGVYPNTLFVTVFGEDAFPGMTLLQVLNQGGGDLNALGRIIVGAYLNAATIENFPSTTAQVIADFQAAYPGGDYSTLQAKYEALQDPCPLGNNPGPAGPDLPTTSPGKSQGKGKSH